MVDWILEFSGAKTVAATGQNDKNNAGEQRSCLFLQDIVAVVFVSFDSLQLARLINLVECR